MTTDTRDARDTRLRLLDAASELFHSRSYHAVGVKDICDHADVKRGSFYYFYPSKEALAIAVIERHWAVVVHDVLEPTLESDGPALERVLGFMTALHGWAERVIGSKRPIPGCPFANFAVELATQEEPIRMIIAGAFDRIT
ncbi:MAG: TetR family transcriptional regulator, partial [Armatimonadia bacterium]|nr:TetR family transcriptional regulator [Armatimonadia bacterium]